MGNSDKPRKLRKSYLSITRYNVYRNKIATYVSRNYQYVYAVYVRLSETLKICVVFFVNDFKHVNVEKEQKLSSTHKNEWLCN